LLDVGEVNLGVDRAHKDLVRTTLDEEEADAEAYLHRVERLALRLVDRHGVGWKWEKTETALQRGLNERKRSGNRTEKGRAHRA
jgi:hypothetical protein